MLIKTLDVFSYYNFTYVSFKNIVLLKNKLNTY